MSSTIGHALCGASFWLLARKNIQAPTPAIRYRWLAGFMLLACLPDLDFIAGYIFANNVHQYHSGASHSIVAVCLATVAIGVTLPFCRNLKILRWIFVALASHIVIDLFTGPQLGLYESYGVMLFWPFSTDRITMPMSLFYGVQHATFADLTSWHNLKVVGFEILTFGLLLVLQRSWMTRHAS